MRTLIVGILSALTFLSVGCQQQYRPAAWQDRSSNQPASDRPAVSGETASSDTNLDRFGKLTPWDSPAASTSQIADNRGENRTLSTLPGRSQKRGNFSTLPSPLGTTLPSRRTGTTLPNAGSSDRPSASFSATGRMTTLPLRRNSTLPSRARNQDSPRSSRPDSSTTLPGNR